MIMILHMVLMMIRILIMLVDDSMTFENVIMNL